MSAVALREWLGDVVRGLGDDGSMDDDEVQEMRSDLVSFLESIMSEMDLATVPAIRSSRDAFVGHLSDILAENTDTFVDKFLDFLEGELIKSQGSATAPIGGGEQEQPDQSVDKGTWGTSDDDRGEPSQDAQATPDASWFAGRSSKKASDPGASGEREGRNWWDGKSFRTILVRNIPVEKFTITDIADFFKKFGNISNVKLSTPDRRYAFVEFSSHGEARDAYQTSEAILGNRFVRLSFAHKDGPDMSGPPPTERTYRGQRGLTRGSLRGRGRGRGGKPNPVEEANGETSPADPSPQESVPSSAQTLSRGDLETAAGDENPEEVNARKRKEIEERIEVQKRMKKEEAARVHQIRENIQSQLEEQKSLFAKVEEGGVTEAEKETIMGRLRELSASLASAISASGVQPREKPHPSIDQIEQNLQTVKQQLGALGGSGLEASARGTLRGGFRGRSGWRGMGRGGFMEPRSLDLRPRSLRLEVREGETTAEDEIRSKLRDIEDLVKVGSAWVVKFGTRRSAEVVQERSEKLLGEKFNVTWADGNEAPPLIEINDEASVQNGA
eukprot:CAMPEP_0184682264 /NCGR_PEP_ID=MMETSP0312-20130426/6545_1 /TAXON_ID=31354 /ORGANISM="Compsopogon coeruleus, Strain SAG 36.94" /LENGTH=557 /DNA_ID=CAMNT_0027133815 /DNA_START=101 /DNA_END=1774 /DNA_ORIENTATION=+